MASFNFFLDKKYGYVKLKKNGGVVMRKTGFTLIELVMVIVIIGILAAVAIPRFMDLRDEAKIARCQADVGAIRTGISGWYAKFNVAGGNVTNNCPSTVSGDCVQNGTGMGFPTAASLNATTPGFGNFAFSNQQMPDKSHIFNGNVSNWGGGYNENTGDLNQTLLCTK
jgi:prepilin-type N-terminal cleavage/methylation domain-containing protein